MVRRDSDAENTEGEYSGARGAEHCDDECQKALRELYTYLDGQLTIERRTTIKAHIEYCSPCMESYTFEAELKQVVALRCQEEVPEALRMKVFEAIQWEIRGD
jgi:mycothiol system anti-sigma-R factor